jgi:hypothetical protein
LRPSNALDHRFFATHGSLGPERDRHVGVLKNYRDGVGEVMAVHDARGSATLIRRPFSAMVDRCCLSSGGFA